MSLDAGTDHSELFGFSELEEAILTGEDATDRIVACLERLADLETRMTAALQAGLPPADHDLATCAVTAARAARYILMTKPA